MRCTLYRNVVGGRSAAGERLVGLEGFEKGREFQPHCFDKQLELAEFGGLLGYRSFVDEPEFAAELVDVDAVVHENFVVVVVEVNDTCVVLEFFEYLVVKTEGIHRFFVHSSWLFWLVNDGGVSTVSTVSTPFYERGQRGQRGQE